MSPRRLLLFLLAAVPAASGCLGLTQNPSYFPFYLPTGDIEPTHAKPPGLGYFRNFDPKACKLEVTPTSRTSPTRSQVVLIASVEDKDGVPRRKRRVEWMIDGPGHIIEVDESGFAPGRGYKQTDRYAVSYTDYFEHTITRGNDDPRDDFTIRPGQTWCVISSAVEGQTKVTVLAPEVFDWDSGRQFITLNWQDAGFTARKDGEDRDRASGGRQPPDSSTLGERAGDNREVRSGKKAQGADAPRSPGTGTGGVTLDVQLPAAVGVNREVPVTITLANGGRGDSRSATVRARLPADAEFVRADPPARRTGSDLVWTVDSVPGSGATTVTAVLRPTRKGRLRVPVTAELATGDRAETTAEAAVDSAGLSVSVEPAAGGTGDGVPVRVTVANRGAVPVENAVAWVDVASPARVTAAEVTVGRVPAGESKTVTATVSSDKVGTVPVRVNVTADGGLAARGEAAVTFSRAEVGVTVTGPRSVNVGEDALFDVVVTNPGDVPLRNLKVTATVPRGLGVRSAGDNGSVANGAAEWSVGAVPAGGTTTLRLVLAGDRLTETGEVRVTAEADRPNGGRPLDAKAAAPVSVTGRAVVALELAAPGGPIPVGSRAVYRVTVRNAGTAPAAGLEAVVTCGSELRPVGRGRVSGQTVAFPLADALPPGGTAVFTVEADAVSAGDARVTAEVRGRDLPKPLRDEQPTRVTAGGDGR